MVMTEVTVWLQLSADSKMQKKEISFPVILFLTSTCTSTVVQKQIEGIKAKVPAENLPKSSY